MLWLSLHQFELLHRWVSQQRLGVFLYPQASRNTILKPVCVISDRGTHRILKPRFTTLKVRVLFAI